MPVVSSRAAVATGGGPAAPAQNGPAARAPGGGAGGLAAASPIVALPSSKMASRTVTLALPVSAVGNGASAAGGAGAAGLAAGLDAGRGGANRVVIGRVLSGRRSMCTHDFFMCTRSIVAVAGQV